MRKALSILCAVFVCGCSLAADVKLPPVLSSHMVLQQGIPVPIWGTAGPGDKITVKFRDQQKAAEADAKGHWMVKLDPLQLGDPASLTVSGTNTVTLDDVLVGEVWVGSGQSNMQMTVPSYEANDPGIKEIAAGTYPKLRLISAGGHGWTEATPENNHKFSALLFSFGVPLQKELNIPVGLMVGAVGGTPSGYWLSEEMYAADDACKAVVAKAAASYNLEAAQKKYEQDVAAWEKATADIKAKADPKADPKTLKFPRKPGAPLKPGEASGKIGNLYMAHIHPYLPFAIKGVLWDQGESGTALQSVDQCSLMGALIRGWRKEWGQGDFPFIYVQKPSGGGCAWDNADPVTNKGEAFAPLPDDKQAGGNNAYVENHIKIMQYPNTAMSISTDMGSGTHPTNKSGYGMRASRVALGMAYGKKVEYYGPLYQSNKVEDGKIRIAYSHVGQGLAPKHAEKLQGFAIAGEDKVFHWADAVIDGETVLVSSAKVPKPMAVRYAWASPARWANLFNKDGLPAIAFRTDSW